MSMAIVLDQVLVDGMLRNRKFDDFGATIIHSPKGRTEKDAPITSSLRKSNNSSFHWKLLSRIERPLKM